MNVLDEAWAGAVEAFNDLAGEPAMVYPAQGMRFGPIQVRRLHPSATAGFDLAVLSTRTTVFRVSTSDWPAPRRGDRIEIGGDVAQSGQGAEAFTIQGAPLRNDAQAREWTIDTVPA